MAQLIEVGSGSSGGSAVVGPGNVVFVDPILGNDGTGQRGNAAKPFATFNAALGVVQSGDTVMLSPGTHVVTGAPYPPYPALSSLTIAGYGRDVTVLAGGPGCIPIQASVGTIVDSLVVQDMNVTSDVRCIEATGATAARRFMPTTGTIGGVKLSRVRLGGAAGFSIAYCRQFILDDVICDAQGNIIDTSGALGYSATIDGLTCSDLNVRWDNDSPDAPANPGFPFGPSRSPVTIRDSFATGYFSLELQPAVVVERGCVMGIVTAGPGGLTEALSGAVPSIQFAGRILGSIDFTGGAALPDSISAGNYTFQDVEMGVGTSAAFGRAGTVNGRSTVYMLGTTWPLTGGNLVAQDGVDVFSESGTSPTYSTTNLATITPKHWTANPVAAPAGATIVPFGWNAFSAPTNVLVSANAAGCDACVTARAANAVTVTVAAPCSVDVRCEWGT